MREKRKGLDSKRQKRISLLSLEVQREADHLQWRSETKRLAR